jgi:transcriptional regulator with XRE-family HTH domain
VSRDAFGPNLRRLRLRRGVSLASIAAATKISTDLLTGLERNDFSRWPSGIYARAYIRQYSYAIGVDPDATVDEFCRCFPQGDRRAYRTISEQSGIVNHDLDWRDDLPTGSPDRRGASSASHEIEPPADSPLVTLLHRVRRALIRA